MLNLTSSDKTSETLFHLLSAIIADLTLCAYFDVHLQTCIVLHGYFPLSMTSGPTTKGAGSEVLL